MGSCSSKSVCRKVMGKITASSAAVHPWSPAEVPAGQRVTVRMRASEFRALAARRAAGANDGDSDVGRLILDGCAVGRWTWSPA